MKKIILSAAISLDGHMEGPNGEYDWCLMDEEMDFAGFFDSIDTIFYGRKSYDLFARNKPETFQSEEERKMYETSNSKKKYVFSHSLTSVPEPDTIINGDIAAAVQQLKNEPGKDIWLFGGASLLTTFINLDLVDEYRLGLHPIILGAGHALFTQISQRTHVQLVQTRTFKNGVVELVYHRA